MTDSSGAARRATRCSSELYPDLALLQRSRMTAAWGPGGPAQESGIQERGAWGCPRRTQEVRSPVTRRTAIVSTTGKGGSSCPGSNSSLRSLRFPTCSSSHASRWSKSAVCARGSDASDGMREHALAPRIEHTGAMPRAGGPPRRTQWKKSPLPNVQVKRSRALTKSEESADRMDLIAASTASGCGGGGPLPFTRVRAPPGSPPPRKPSALAAHSSVTATAMRRGPILGAPRTAHAAGGPAARLRWTQPPVPRQGHPRKTQVPYDEMKGEVYSSRA